MLFSLPLVAKSQESRWSILFTDSVKKEKTLIDKELTLKYRVFEGKLNVVIIWIRKLSKPTQGGEYVQQDDEKIAVAVSDNQIELKATLERYNGQTTSQQQFDEISWQEIYPETVGESYLAYCKEYLKTNP
jgi:hypothetical protein